MRYLLDTNIFLFLCAKAEKRMSLAQRKISSNPDNELYLSEASLFEIAIKSRLSKDNFNHVNIDALENHRKRLRVKLLPSKEAYYLNIVNVPKVIIKGEKKIHSDPFDILIISQALYEDIPLLSVDRFFKDYEGLKFVG